MPEQLLPVIPLLPLLGFLVNALFGRRLPKRVSGWVACGVMLAAFAVSAVVSWQLLALPEGPTRVIAKNVYTWIAAGDFHADVAFRLDPLATLMILIVT